MSSRELFIEVSAPMLCVYLACWFRSCAVLKFDQFYHSNFLYTEFRLVSSEIYVGLCESD